MLAVPNRYSPIIITTMARIFYIGAPLFARLPEDATVADLLRLTGNNTGNLLIGPFNVILKRSSILAIWHKTAVRLNVILTVL
jgi:hypothetical protein